MAKWIEEGIIKPDGSDIENIPYKETNTYVRKWFAQKSPSSPQGPSSVIILSLSKVLLLG